MTFTLIDNNRNTEKEFDTRAEAEEKKNDMVGLGASPEDLEIVTDSSSGADNTAGANTKKTTQVESDGGQAAEVVEPDATELPDEQPGVDTDPLDWVPSDFVDSIDGTQTINRKGYDVIAHHYNISVTTKVRVSPSETDYKYAEVVATAVTEDDVRYSAHGSAHVERGDDSYLLLEMADTRAAKRATARASGVGMVAVSELQNEL